MPKFINLTCHNDRPLIIDSEYILAIELAEEIEDGDTVITFILLQGLTIPCRVKETVNEIMELIKNA